MTDFPEIEEVHIILDEVAEEIPKEFFNKLNEGIILLPRYKLHPESRPSNKLYILGEYRKSITGRKIVIYYGSFKKVHANKSMLQLRKKLKDTLLHEFTHHLESLAGEKGLEIKDREKLERYRDE
ncbi:MAG: metallopeptidase family protein [Tissierellia bacterium]|nr:metallopeptidase family protein [Tissierellia bacterium]MDD4726538.1 metallopeptidase family protein [Tissierellia bacterium]